MNNNTQETRSIEDLVKMIESGKLVLPEFQRDFKWPIEKSETLFDSIFQGLFIGSLIISRPKFNLACKDFDLRERVGQQKKRIDHLSEKFKELKKLAIEYKNQKDLEIKNLNKDIDKFKKSTEEHKSQYETMLDKTTQSLEKIIQNTETISKIQ